jgi:hypothetical protein
MDPGPDGKRTCVLLTSLDLLSDDGPRVTTGFEDWCDAHRIHPEAFGAWEAYAHSDAALSTLG